MTERAGALRVLMVLHGYPPREVAGTELVAARLGCALETRGWEVHVLASTRAPGRRQYEVICEGRVTRIVNNLPWRPLGTAERDEVVETLVDRVVHRVEPDLVHVHHAAFLSSGMRFPVPAVGTLHDHWPWCPAGGLMLYMGAGPCAGPASSRCPGCAAAHAAAQATRGELLLTAVARRLAPMIAPDRLHRAWRRLPERLRSLLRGGRPSAPEPPVSLARRQKATGDLWASMEIRMAPSRYLAEEAARHGLGPVRVLRNGVPAGPPRVGGGPLVFLGSLVPHKGAHIVVEAYRRAFGEGGPGLALHGPVGDPEYARALGWPLAGPVEPAEVPALLARAGALVIGSTWPENAPLVALEAMASGCPVLAPMAGGIPEYVRDGMDGHLYSPRSTEDLARKMLDIVASPPPDVAAPPTLSAHVAEVEGVYLEALGRRLRWP